jgi:flagellar motility protein MotE (MotC chaperone)
VISTKRAELEQQLRDITNLQSELDVAEARCVETLKELKQKQQGTE